MSHARHSGETTDFDGVGTKRMFEQSFIKIKDELIWSIVFVLVFKATFLMKLNSY